MKKKKNSPDEIVLPGKAKLNTIEVLISKYLVFSVNNVLSRYTEMKEEITITYHSNRKTDKYDKLMKIDTATEVLTTK